MTLSITCLLYTSDAADERSSVDLGGRRIIKKNKYDKLLRGSQKKKNSEEPHTTQMTHIKNSKGARKDQM